MDQQMFWT